MPKLLPRQYAKILYAVTSEAKDISAAVNLFIDFLKKKRVTKRLPAIIAEFLNCTREKEGIKSVRVTMARPMAENKIIELVKKILGGEVAVQTEINDSIVGGMIVQTNTHCYDVSVKNQLTQLSNHLVKK